jgi:hypothetical protein
MHPHSSPTSGKESSVSSRDAKVHYQSAYRLRKIEPPRDVTARLEWLDDLMFAAIDGDPVALDAAADAWKKALDELGPQVVEQSRLQYMRRAQRVWNELRHKPNHPPHKVFAAIEVISLLASRAR